MDTPRILFAMLLVSVAGCSKSQETLSQSDVKLVPVYAELLVARERFQSPASTIDSLHHRRMADSILGTAGISQTEFSTRIAELAVSQKLYQEFQNRVRMYLDSTRTTPKL
jgi:hypothetical protein